MNDFFGGAGGAGRLLTLLGSHLVKAESNTYVLLMVESAWKAEEGFNGEDDAVWHGESYWNRKRDSLRKSWPELAEALDEIGKV